MAWRFAVIFSGMLAGCHSTTPTFDCSRAGVSCNQGETCIENRCAGPDGNCPSGLRYTESAGSLAGECVAGEVDGGEADAPIITDGAPEPDAAALTTRIFVQDGNDSLFVFNAETLEQLGTTTLPPQDCYSSRPSLAHGSIWVLRTNCSTSPNAVAAVDPTNGIMRPGYPKNVPSCNLRIVGEIGLYCATSTAIQLYSSSDFSTLLRSATVAKAPGLLDPIGDFILAAIGNDIHVYDKQLSEIGSPMANVFQPIALAVSSELNRIAVADFSGFTLYNLTTHTKVGARRSFSKTVTSVAFDRTRLIVTLVDGSVAAYTVDDATAELVPPTIRGGDGLKRALFDGTRNRIIAFDNTHLIVLDEELKHVPGSPSPLQAQGLFLTTF